jgi:hypothetical protein
VPFPSSIKVSMDPKKVFIGDPNNKIVFLIETTSSALELKANVVLPYQSTGPFLVKGDDSPVGKFELEGVSAEIVKKKSPNGAAWELPMQKMKPVKPGSPLKITIGNLTAKSAEGIAKISFKIEIKNDATVYEESLDVEIALRADPKPVIHYFGATPDFILHGGEDEVHLKWRATPPEAVVTLTKNNVVLCKKGAGTAETTLSDTPSITSSYRLTVNCPNKLETAISQNTVQVAQAGWNQQALPQGYPTLLLAMDEPESGTYAIYGIFIAPDGKPALWTSPSGFADWEQIDEPFPAGMEFSPGVAFGGKLWLIGGSAVHTGKWISNNIWRFDPRTREWKKEEAAPQLTPRMGHSCVVFQNKIWVLGGANQTATLSEVWSCEGEGKGWRKYSSAPWPARCMFASVTTPAYDVFTKPRLWIYGGKRTASEIDSRSDIWWTEDGETWRDGTETFQLKPAPGTPSGATLFFDECLLLAGSFLNGNTLTSHVYKLNAAKQFWEDNPVSWGWEQFGGKSFLLQSVVYNRFYFFWSIASAIKTPPRLNIFIP